MLTKIREKSQGVFAWVILILICVPFALWGIQNYVGGASEATIATVGGKEFLQQDLSRAYAQYSQNFAGMNIDENEIKKRALDKLIKDEVLLQHVQGEGLVVTDPAAKKFIQDLDYFKLNGKFDKKQYKSLLGSQQISSNEFVGRIKKAMVMDQFQRSVIESGFSTEKDIENFFKIQNQTRDVEIISVALKPATDQPTDQEIEDYYQINQNAFLTDEQISIEYVELSLDDLAQQLEPSLEQLENYYNEQKDLYTTKERRKISHILFSFDKKVDDEAQQLQRAIAAKQALQEKEFAVLAAEISDDKLTAVKGGDLGLFNIGVMEKAFEDAASSLKLNEVSEPVKSAFGYHLIKVTELIEGDVKSFESVKEEVGKAVRRADAESTFYELAETLTEVSFENPGSLEPAAEALSVEVKKTGLFNKIPKSAESKPDDLVSNPAIIKAAFSEDVLKGNNSEAIEVGADKVVVLRMMEHKPAATKAIDQVEIQITAILQHEKAKQLTTQLAEEIKTAVMTGKPMKTAADENNLKLDTYKALKRSGGDLAWQVNQAVFKAAKPVDGNATVVSVADATGSQTVIKLMAVTEGVMSASDKAKMQLAEKNMSQAFGKAEFNAVLNSLQASADVSINIAE